jgi:hypothetical protein
MSITEIIRDHTHLEANGKLSGQMQYEYISPTHWSSPCSVTIWYSAFKEPEVTMNYGAGGCNKGFTDIQIAKALSDVFAMAADRMTKIASTGETV